MLRDMDGVASISRHKEHYLHSCLLLWSRKETVKRVSTLEAHQRQSLFVWSQKLLVSSTPFLLLEVLPFLDFASMLHRFLSSISIVLLIALLNFVTAHLPPSRGPAANVSHSSLFHLNPLCKS